MWTSPLLYERLTWPEVRRAVAEDRVCLIPVATLEDHGPHLPLDTDLRLTAEICRRAAEVAPEEIVLLPAIPHGYSPHHMDFPGTITIGWDTFTRYLVDIGTSLAQHGFRRLLYLNGHGSNQNLVETAARLVGVEHSTVLAAAAFHTSSAASARVIAGLRESGPGGMAHACELETSMYLAIDPDAVYMERAVDERGYPAGEHATMDWADGPLKIMPWWSSFSAHGRPGGRHEGDRREGPSTSRRGGCRVRRVRPRAPREAAAGAACSARNAAVKATRFGRPLPPGGTIGVAAPASPYENRSEVLRGVEWWETRGYRVKLANGIYARDDYVAGDPRERARDLMALFADPEVDVVQCARGGYGSAQVIP